MDCGANRMSDATLIGQAAAFEQHASAFEDRLNAVLDAEHAVPASTDNQCMRQIAWATCYYRYATVAAAKATLRTATAEVETALRHDPETAVDKAKATLDRLLDMRDRLAAVRTPSTSVCEQLPQVHVDTPRFALAVVDAVDNAPTKGNDRLTPLETFDGSAVADRLEAVIAAATAGGTD